ncbi:hypothetical protein T07_13247 [Trichinella nelsoni]|uniref:Uncharacterized protein n=1 Tax=Trichinella nelsoni TaxID=6336 RepID=A0A0V0RKH3_9BILA|nr:hypothetical protein T07_13247 [Trichinella nelsoni]
MPGWQFNVGWSVIETDNRIISLCIYVIVVVFCGKGKKNSNDETQPPNQKFCFGFFLLLKKDPYRFTVLKNTNERKFVCKLLSMLKLISNFHCPLLNQSNRSMPEGFSFLSYCCCFSELYTIQHKIVNDGIWLVSSPSIQVIQCGKNPREKRDNSIE